MRISGSGSGWGMDDGSSKSDGAKKSSGSSDLK
jgi:hypothetical protein